MEGSSIDGGRNLKGYNVRGIFQKWKKTEKKKKKSRKKGRKLKVDMKILVEKKAHNFFIRYQNFKRKDS